MAFLYSIFRRLPLKEVSIPFKMLLGSKRNKGAVMPPFKPATEGRGQLEIVNSIPILRLRGSPRDLGYQHGKLLSEQIRWVNKRYLGIFAGRFEYDLKLAKKMEPHIPPRFVEELRGVAEGSGISYDELLVSACFLDLHKVAACSTFVVRDGSSKSGEILFGRNLDFPALKVADQANMLMVYEPDGMRPFVSVTWPGFIGCISGMNAEGLALAMMLIYGHTRSDHLNGVPFALHYRAVLEECGSVAAATEKFKRREYGVCNNMMLADAARDAAVLELHADSVGELRDASEFPVLCATNHFRTGHRKWALALTAPSSYPRLWRMYHAIKKGRAKQQPFDADEVKAVLGRVAIPGINLQRMIFYPQRRAIEVAFGEPCAGPNRTYHMFDKDALWRAGLPKAAMPHI